MGRREKMKPLQTLRELKERLQLGTQILQIWNGRDGVVRHMLTVTKIQTQAVETTCPDFRAPYWISFPNRRSVIFTEDGWIRMRDGQKMAEYVWGETTYWIEKYEARGCIDLSEEEKAGHSAEEWREMYEALVKEQERVGQGELLATGTLEESEASGH
jgi:hypothetical protein